MADLKESMSAPGPSHHVGHTARLLSYMRMPRAQQQGEADAKMAVDAATPPVLPARDGNRVVLRQRISRLLGGDAEGPYATKLRR